MSNYLVTDQELTAVADAIRAKGGTSDPLIFPTGFVDAIGDIQTGGGGGGEVVDFTVSVTYPVYYTDESGNFVVLDPDIAGSDQTAFVGRALRGSLVVIVFTSSPGPYPFSQTGLTQQRSFWVSGKQVNVSQIRFFTAGT